MFIYFLVCINRFIGNDLVINGNCTRSFCKFSQLNGISPREESVISYSAPFMSISHKILFVGINKLVKAKKFNGIKFSMELGHFYILK